MTSALVVGGGFAGLESAIQLAKAGLDVTLVSNRPYLFVYPTSIWIVLFLIASVVFAYMLFFADSGEGAVSQAMLMGSATTVIVLTLMAINALDDPYGSAVGRIKPVAMERSLRILASERTVVHERAPLPCDARGAPVSS